MRAQSAVWAANTLHAHLLHGEQRNVHRSEQEHRTLGDRLDLGYSPRVNFAHKPIVGLLRHSIPLLLVAEYGSTFCTHRIDQLCGELCGWQPLVIFDEVEQLRERVSDRIRPRGSACRGAGMHDQNIALWFVWWIFAHLVLPRHHAGRW